jgi:hypothetical protein
MAGQSTCIRRLSDPHCAAAARPAPITARWRARSGNSPLENAVVIRDLDKNAGKAPRLSRGSGPDQGEVGSRLIGLAQGEGVLVRRRNS